MSEQNARVALGEVLSPVGLLRFTRSGPRQFSTFSYEQSWRDNPDAFAIPPDLATMGGLIVEEPRNRAQGLSFVAPRPATQPSTV